jgi:hypothetical protein
VKKLILIFTTIFLLTGLQAGLAEDAGEVKGDTLYLDNNYEFSLKVSDGWKIKKVGDDDDIRRLIVLKRSPVVPMHFGNDRSYFTPPMLTLLADTTELEPDSLLHLIEVIEDEDIDIVEEALKRFTMPSRANFTPEFDRTRRARVGDFEGVKVEVQKQYTINIDDQFDGAPRRVSDYIYGVLYVLKKDDLAVIAECVSEKERFGFNEKDFEAMVESIDDLHQDEEESEENKADKPAKKQNQGDVRKADDKSSEG